MTDIRTEFSEEEMKSIGKHYLKMINHLTKYSTTQINEYISDSDMNEYLKNVAALTILKNMCIAFLSEYVLSTKTDFNVDFKDSFDEVINGVLENVKLMNEIIESKRQSLN